MNHQQQQNLTFSDCRFSSDLVLSVLICLVSVVSDSWPTTNTLVGLYRSDPCGKHSVPTDPEGGPLGMCVPCFPEPCAEEAGLEFQVLLMAEHLRNTFY